jgi:hypothetical protein
MTIQNQLHVGCTADFDKIRVDMTAAVMLPDMCIARHALIRSHVLDARARVGCAHRRMPH